MTKTCPHCGGPLPPETKKKADQYNADFIAFWDTYEAGRRCPNASKIDAWRAWQQIEDVRPPQAVLIPCVRAYLAYLDSNKRNPTTACHPATWLRQQRWEGFVNKVSLDEGHRPHIDPSWAGTGELILDRIGAAKFTAWFAGTTLTLGRPVVITVTKPFVKNYISQHFHSHLRAVFGDYEIVVDIAKTATQ